MRSVTAGRRDRHPVGWACGEGLVDWERVLHILSPLERDLFFRVECGTIDEAERSLAYLQGILGAAPVR